jgi:hypothetical protein
MKIGLPRHFTVIVFPTGTELTSNSAEAKANTSADGFMLDTNCKNPNIINVRIIK